MMKRTLTLILVFLFIAITTFSAYANTAPPEPAKDFNKDILTKKAKVKFKLSSAINTDGWKGHIVILDIIKEELIKDELLNNTEFVQELPLFKNYIVSIFMVKDDIRVLVKQKTLRVRKQEMEVEFDTSKLPIEGSFDVKLYYKDANNTKYNYSGDSTVKLKHKDYPITLEKSGSDTITFPYLVKGKYEAEISGNNIIDTVKKDIYVYTKSYQDVIVPYKGTAKVNINFLNPLKKDASVFVGTTSYIMRAGEQIKSFDVQSGDVTVNVTMAKSTYIKKYNLRHNAVQLVMLNEDADYSYMTENLKVEVCNMNQNPINFSFSRKQKVDNFSSGSDWSGRLYAYSCTESENLQRGEYSLEWTETEKAVTIKEKATIRYYGQRFDLSLDTTNSMKSIDLELRAKKPDNTDVEIDANKVSITAFNSLGGKETFDKTKKLDLYFGDYELNINIDGFVSKTQKITVCEKCKTTYRIYFSQTEQTRAVSFKQDIDKDDSVRIVDAYIETTFYDKVNNKTEKTLVNIEGQLLTKQGNKVHYQAYLPTNKSFIASLVLKCEAVNTKFEYITTQKISVLSTLQTDTKPEFNYPKAEIKGEDVNLYVKRRNGDVTLLEENPLTIKFETSPTSNSTIKNGIRNLSAINPGTKVWLPNKAYIRVNYGMVGATDINKYIGGKLNESENQAYAFTIGGAVDIDKPERWDNFKEYVTPIKYDKTKSKAPMIYLEYAQNSKQEYYLGVAFDDEYINKVEDKNLTVLTDKATIKKKDGKYRTEMDILALKKPVEGTANYTETVSFTATVPEQATYEITRNTIIMTVERDPDGNIVMRKDKNGNVLGPKYKRKKLTSGPFEVSINEALKLGYLRQSSLIDLQNGTINTNSNKPTINTVLIDKTTPNDPAGGGGTCSTGLDCYLFKPTDSYCRVTSEVGEMAYNVTCPGGDPRPPCIYEPMGYYYVYYNAECMKRVGDSMTKWSFSSASYPYNNTLCNMGWRDGDLQISSTQHYFNGGGSYGNVIKHKNCLSGETTTISGTPNGPIFNLYNDPSTPQPPSKTGQYRVKNEYNNTKDVYKFTTTKLPKDAEPITNPIEFLSKNPAATEVVIVKINVKSNNGDAFPAFKGIPDISTIEDNKPKSSYRNILIEVNNNYVIPIISKNIASQHSKTITFSLPKDKTSIPIKVYGYNGKTTYVKDKGYLWGEKTATKDTKELTFEINPDDTFKVSDNSTEVVVVVQAKTDWQDGFKDKRVFVAFYPSMANTIRAITQGTKADAFVFWGGEVFELQHGGGKETEKAVITIKRKEPNNKDEKIPVAFYTSDLDGFIQKTWFVQTVKSYAEQLKNKIMDYPDYYYTMEEMQDKIMEAGIEQGSYTWTLKELSAFKDGEAKWLYAVIPHISKSQLPVIPKTVKLKVSSDTGFYPNLIDASLTITCLSSVKKAATGLQTVWTKAKSVKAEMTVVKIMGDGGVRDMGEFVVKNQGGQVSVLIKKTGIEMTEDQFLDRFAKIHNALINSQVAGKLHSVLSALTQQPFSQVVISATKMLMGKTKSLTGDFMKIVTPFGGLPPSGLPYIQAKTQGDSTFVVPNCEGCPEVLQITQWVTNYFNKPIRAKEVTLPLNVKEGKAIVIKSFASGHVPYTAIIPWDKNTTEHSLDFTMTRNDSHGLNPFTDTQSFFDQHPMFAEGVETFAVSPEIYAWTDQGGDLLTYMSKGARDFIIALGSNFKLPVVDWIGHQIGMYVENGLNN